MAHPNKSADGKKTVSIEDAMRDPKAVELFAHLVLPKEGQAQPTVEPGDSMRDVAEAASPENPASLDLAAKIALYLTGYGGDPVPEPEA